MAIYNVNYRIKPTIHIRKVGYKKKSIKYYLYDRVNKTLKNGGINHESDQRKRIGINWRNPDT